MGTVVKKKQIGVTRKAAKKGKIKVSDLPDLSNDPFFVKKAESAKKLLDQYGPPKF
jgi:hypothetical protein